MADDRDEERKRKAEEIRQGLETALSPTKDVGGTPPPSDLTGPYDSTVGTGRDGREPARTAPSAEEGTRGDERDLAMDEREEHDEQASQRDTDAANRGERRDT